MAGNFKSAVLPYVGANERTNERTNEPRTFKFIVLIFFFFRFLFSIGARVQVKKKSLDLNVVSSKRSEISIDQAVYKVMRQVLVLTREGFVTQGYVVEHIGHVIFEFSAKKKNDNVPRKRTKKKRKKAPYFIPLDSVHIKNMDRRTNDDDISSDEEEDESGDDDQQSDPFTPLTTRRRSGINILFFLETNLVPSVV